MDYTDLYRVKEALGTGESGDDTLLSTCITAASRAMDRYVTRAVNSDNYFALETKTNEEISGRIDAEGSVVCWPRKPVTSSVSSMSWRARPRDSWAAVESSDIQIHDARITAYEQTIARGMVRVRISYTGGFATVVNELPEDLVEVATVMTVRFYREIKSGLTDSIGVAELGTLLYTKAIPVRVAEMLKPYQRVVGW